MSDSKANHTMSNIRVEEHRKFDKPTRLTPLFALALLHGPDGPCQEQPTTLACVDTGAAVTMVDEAFAARWIPNAPREPLTHSRSLGLGGSTPSVISAHALTNITFRNCAGKEVTLPIHVHRTVLPTVDILLGNAFFEKVGAIISYSKGKTFFEDHKPGFEFTCRHPRGRTCGSKAGISHGVTDGTDPTVRYTGTVLRIIIPLRRTAASVVMWGLRV